MPSYQYKISLCEDETTAIPPYIHISDIGMQYREDILIIPEATVAVDFYGSEQNCSISIANALELLQSCTKPSTLHPWFTQPPNKNWRPIPASNILMDCNLTILKPYVFVVFWHCIWIYAMLNDMTQTMCYRAINYDWSLLIFHFMDPNYAHRNVA